MADQADERQQIEQTIRRYFDGLYYSSGEDIKATFHPDAMITGFMSDSGEMVTMTCDKFIAFVETQASPESTGEPYELAIIAIDITGQVAMAKVIDRYLGKSFTDYLLLVKDDGDWRIYNKLWHADPV